MMTLKFFIAFGIVISRSNLFGQYGSLPEFAMGSRAMALGYTAGASFSDALAVSQNPASATGADQITVSAFYSRLKYGGRNSSVGLLVPTKDYGFFGISFFELGIEFEEADEFGNVLGVLTFSQKHLILTHARKIGKHFSWGANAKFVVQSFGELQSGPENAGIDLGLQYMPHFSQPLLRHLAFGLVIDNLVQPTLKLDRERQALPREVGLIVEKQFFFAANRLSLLMNLISKEVFAHRNENDIETYKKLSRPEMHIGVEYAFGGYFFRTGYFQDTISAGMGLQIKSLQLGYSFNRLNFNAGVNANHGVSLNYAF